MTNIPATDTPETMPVWPVVHAVGAIRTGIGSSMDVEGRGTGGWLIVVIKASGGSRWGKKREKWLTECWLS